MIFINRLSCLIFVILMSCIPVSCTSISINKIIYRGYDIEQEVLPYVIQFEKDCETVVSMDITFSKFDNDPDSEHNPIAYCSFFFGPHIVIDYNWWKKNPDIHVREQLVYHELGHCALYRIIHIDKIKSIMGIYDMPISIMHPYAFGNLYVYMFKREYYVNELCPKK